MPDLIDGLWDAVQTLPQTPHYLIARRGGEWIVLHAETRAQTGTWHATRRAAVDYAESRQRADDGYANLVGSGFDSGARAEREATVEWLRGLAKPGIAVRIDWLIEQLERREYPL